MKNPFTAEARRLAGLRLQQEYAKHSRGNAGADGDHYDENQPRVPSGQPGGGQWTSGGGGASQGAGKVASLGRSPLQNLLKGHIVDGEPNESVQPASFALGRVLAAPLVGIAPSAQRAVAAALATYAAHLANPSPNRLPILLFNAREFARGNAQTITQAESRVLNREQVKDICKRLDYVQSLTDKTVRTLSAGPQGWRPTDFGTAVHSSIAATVNGKNREDFKAEVSFLKGLQETKEQRLYGKLGTIRVDVLETIDGSKVVCVYDVKTGKSILNPARMLEIASNVFKAFGKFETFVVVEVKPTTPR